MVLEGNEILIYYPDSRQAFKIKSQTPSVIPFFEAFIGVIKEDYGLGELGYKFSHYDKKGNILISYWKPERKFSKIIGECILAYRENKLIFLEIKNPDNQTFSRIEYANHIKYGNIYFPLEILTTKKKGSAISIERVIYKNPVFNSPLPPEVVNFKIPEGVTIKEIQL